MCQFLNTLCIIAILLGNFHKTIIIRCNRILYEIKNTTCCTVQIIKCLLDISDCILDTFDSRSGSFRQFSNLRSDHRKTFSLFPGTCCFNGCV